MSKKILLIGAGRWGTNHLKSWLSLGVELYVAEASEALLEKCRAAGVPSERLSKNHRDFLPLVDGVDVVTPVETHFPLGSEALEMGKDLFLEKPLTDKTSTSRRLVELAKAKGRILQVGHVFRYEQPTQHVRRLMESGELGKIRWIRGNFSAFKRPRADSGTAMADGVHFVDLFNYLLGSQPDRVQARLLDILGRGGDFDDQAWIWLDYGGVFGAIETGCFSPRKTRDVLVVGDRKTVWLDYMAKQEKVKVFANTHRMEKGQWQAVEGEVQSMDFPPEEPLKAELKAFMESMQTRSRPLVDGEAGAAAVHVVEALMASHRKGAPVEMSCFAGS
ncbi:MAG: Gfo/Idh/MocA family oxidoreductase [Verrucomicrobiae bacterium]|nr:Gfo/Idh/MocA family oxidoreductase [Verrucomicrobiae bacterium]